MRNVFMWGVSALLILATSLSSFASATRIIDVDQMKSSDHTKTYSLPTVTTTLIGSDAVVQEVPAGTINGTTTSFTLSFTPASTGSFSLYLDGLLLIGGSTDYSFSGTTLTMTVAPANGQSLRAVYNKY